MFVLFIKYSWISILFQINDATGKSLKGGKTTKTIVFLWHRRKWLKVVLIIEIFLD
jgi:hypothetical protein